MREEVPKDGAATPAHDAAETEAAEAPKPVKRRRESRRLLRAEVYYGAGLLAFAVLALLAHVYAYFAWDLRLARAVQSIDLPGWGEFMRLVSIPGNHWHPHALATLTGLVFFAWRRRSECFALALSAGGGAIINRVFKILIARPRPPFDLLGCSYRSDELSFPSGHVVFYVCYFGFLFFAAYALLPRGTNRRRAALALSALPVLLVGLSRVSLCAHWPSDVLGAYLLSGLWLAFSLELYRRWKRRATFHPEEAPAGDGA
ncbi:MAG TPA: phosphatase PAP2 family protein [Pyrinomonadaceae bacterium]|nr:phosphatase PAP2 family protein [Pyrinomonadaceae bacterium]